DGDPRGPEADAQRIGGARGRPGRLAPPGPRHPRAVPHRRLRHRPPPRGADRRGCGGGRPPPRPLADLRRGHRHALEPRRRRHHQSRPRPRPASQRPRGRARRDRGRLRPDPAGARSGHRRRGAPGSVLRRAPRGRGEGRRARRPQRAGSDDVVPGARQWGPRAAPDPARATLAPRRVGAARRGGAAPPGRARRWRAAGQRRGGAVVLGGRGRRRKPVLHLHADGSL
ncbi:MAG: Pterin-4-alpha-carbinolamine dehydratase, partial [uncultured Nocardioides sp.]